MAATTSFSTTGLYRRPPSPKQTSGGLPLYPYYAGYADAFVKAMTERLGDRGGRLLDPWNGAGTTTAAAAMSGISSVGVDLNPAAFVVAKARLLSSEVVESLKALTEEVTGSLGEVVDRQMDHDPLQAWFAPHSVATLRALERSINRLLVDPAGTEPGDTTAIASFSALAALYYVGLFRTVRAYMDAFRGSNPTWVQKSATVGEALAISRRQIVQRFRSECSDIEEKVRRYKLSYEGRCPATLKLGSSEALNLSRGSVDGVITSPPYCTRIDYVVATAPELSALGISREAVDGLRKQMLGTPVMNRDAWAAAFSETGPTLGSERAQKLLRYVKNHKSHGSSNYYHPFYGQYFYGMERSLREIDRVTRASAPAVFVVQDSFFKKKRIDLAAILREFGEAQGWSHKRSYHYRVRTRAAQNPRSRHYGRRHATETVVIFITDQR